MGHKRCSREYPVKCGQTLDQFEECEQCRRPFLAKDNCDTACLYHFSSGINLARRMQGWCNDCGTFITSTNVGCKVGPHVAKAKKAKKSRGSNNKDNLDDGEV